MRSIACKARLRSAQTASTCGLRPSGPPPPWKGSGSRSGQAGEREPRRRRGHGRPIHFEILVPDFFNLIKRSFDEREVVHLIKRHPPSRRPHRYRKQVHPKRPLNGSPQSAFWRGCLSVAKVPSRPHGIGNSTAGCQSRPDVRSCSNQSGQVRSHPGRHVPGRLPGTVDRPQAMV